MPSDDPTAALQQALGAPPPPGVDDLDHEVVARLADAVHAAHQTQATALAGAVDHALRLVPRPLRGLVRRLVIS